LTDFRTLVWRAAKLPPCPPRVPGYHEVEHVACGG